MKTENLSTLKIHKLSQAQYERELAAGNIDKSAIYLTPEPDIDLSKYATVDQLNGKASSDHSHSEYALNDHKHSWNNLTDKPTIPTIPDALPANGGNADTLDNMHANEFATAGHSHSEYALVRHTHDDIIGSNHTHSYNDLTDKPTIPTIPESLPANGGNADTVDGKHAEEFALSDHNHDGVYVPVKTFNDLVGDTKVEDQIKDQLKDLPIEKEVYVQSDEPIDAADGAVWIDVDAAQIQTDSVVSIPIVTTQDNGKFMMVVDGHWRAVAMPSGEGVEF